MVGRITALLFTGLPLAGIGCASEPPKAPHDLHPIPEAQAAEIIARAFREAGLDTEENRFVEMGKGKRIRLEVAAKGHSYGVAYVTASDQQLLEGSIPPHPEASDALLVEYGEGHQRYLLLYEQDYVEDDMAGEEHTTTSIAANRKLTRDVRDFLHRAKTPGLAVTNREKAARVAILRATLVCAVGVALAGTTSRTVGGFVVVAGWIGMVLALHSYGRAGSDA